MSTKDYLVIIFLYFSCSVAHAQLNATTVGDAISQGNNCFIITRDVLGQQGGVWYDNAIDFDNDFTINYQNNFGNKNDNGADGMALVFKRNPNPELGNSGGGLGYQGLSPSLVVEFDTYLNNTAQEGLLSDPFFDHIAIMRNGNPNHNSADNLAGPVQASSSSTNIEDGSTHEIKIEWIASTTTFNVYFDCVLRLSLNQDVKNTIFSGDDSIFFGFVGSTGGLSNLHQVCFNSISFVDNLQLQDETICESDDIQVNATIPSGVTYSWAPTNGVSNPNIANPSFSPNSTTTYTVTISDVCGDTTVDDFILTVLPNQTPTFNAFLPICEGGSLTSLPTTSLEGVTGTWSPALNNTQTTTYTFTPNSGCANSTTLDIVVIPLTLPTFNAVAPICEGETLAPLPTTSNNGITGTWSPALNNTSTTTYTFTPDTGQGCVDTATLQIDVIAPIIPSFDAVTPSCEGETLAPLPTTSNNGITGTWTPALNNTITTTYTFTPNTGECAIATTLDIIVETPVLPIFDAIDPICEGDTLAPLPTTSNNGITGTWSPALNNTITTTYTFTPNADECANNTNLTITVIPNSIPEFDSVNPICPGEFLQELPLVSNNGITGTWLPTLDNQNTTEYTFTPDAGQGCVASSLLIIEVLQPTIPSFSLPDFICQGDTTVILPSASDEGITGSWSEPINNQITTEYIFTPNPNQCASVIEIEIEVLPVNELELSIELISEPFSDNQIVVAVATGGDGMYEYQLNNDIWTTQNTFSNIRGCDENVIRARQINNCSIDAIETFRVLNYPKFFTPNEDGFNDLWNIECLINQTAARIYIFDRFGKLLKTISPNGLGWNGTYNGEIMPSSDYWFRVDYLDNNGSSRTFTSHFTLKR